MSTARVDFTRGAAERIARVVRLVEGGDRDGAPLTFRKVDVSGGGGGFRICTFSGAWPIGASKVVLRKSNTAQAGITAYNLFSSVSGACEQRDCAVAKDGTAWYLVAVQCE
jgi:hypothetical protein